MIRFPDGFVKTHWPGYFWHLPSQRLYSIKSGTLKELKLYKELWYRMNGRMVREQEPNYQLSLSGRRVTVRLTQLQKLKEPTHPQTLNFIPYA